MTDATRFEFTDEKTGIKYMVDRSTGECFTWIVRQRKASGWQRLKCARRIKRVSKAAIAAFSAATKA